MKVSEQLGGIFYNLFNIYMPQQSYEYKSCAKACEKTTPPKNVYMGGAKKKPVKQPTTHKPKKKTKEKKK